MTRLENYSSSGGAILQRSIFNILDSRASKISAIDSPCQQHQINRSETYFKIYNEMLKTFRSTGFQPGQKLFEFGTGPGFLSSRFESSGLEVFGTDIEDSKHVVSSNMAIAKDDIPFPADVFDYVSATSVLHHIPQEGHMNYITEFKRVLKPSGVILVQEDERGRNTVEQYAIRTVDRLVSGPEANSHRSKDEWIDFFNNNGLTTESANNLCHKKGPIRLNKIFFALTIKQ